MAESSSWDGCGILYSQCWEDPACARSALRIQPGSDVFAIGAAGDNALALLLDEPRRVLAVDVNPAQVALAELKRAAFQHLPAPDIPAFLGAGRHPRRIELFERLRPRLSKSTARWWDNCTDLIARGVIHSGRFERYLALFRRWVLPLIPGRGAVSRMLAASDLPRQEQLYGREWDSPLWRTLVRVFFGRQLLSARARHPAMFAQCQADHIGAHYLERARRALTGVPIHTNPFMAYMLSGRFDCDERTPQYLQRDAAPKLASLANRLQVEVGSLPDILRSLPDRSMDAFYLSDVFELFDAREYEQILVEIARVGRPGARICYWNNLVGRQRPAQLAGLLASHEDEAAALHRQDRAFLYSRFVVEEVRGPA